MKVSLLLVFALIPLGFATLLATHRASPVPHYTRAQRAAEIRALQTTLVELEAQERRFLPRGGR